MKRGRWRVYSWKREEHMLRLREKRNFGRIEALEALSWLEPSIDEVEW